MLLLHQSAEVPTHVLQKRSTVWSTEHCKIGVLHHMEDHYTHLHRSELGDQIFLPVENLNQNIYGHVDC